MYKENDKKKYKKIFLQFCFSSLKSELLIYIQDNNKHYVLFFFVILFSLCFFIKYESFIYINNIYKHYIFCFLFAPLLSLSCKVSVGVTGDFSTLEFVATSFLGVLFASEKNLRMSSSPVFSC